MPLIAEKPQFIDTHTHLSTAAFAADLQDTLDRAQAAGIQKMVAIGAAEGMSSNPAALALAQKYEFIFATVGLHPHDAKEWSEDCTQELSRLARAHTKKIRAWGEIGLDYHYLNSPASMQKEAFVAQIELAAQMNLPVIIHTREAEADTLAFLKEHRAKISQVVVHCFTGTKDFAAGLQELGAYIGVGGVFTFPKAEDLRKVIAAYPLEKILLETDCPYLAPVPHRGKRNEPSFVPLIATKLAEIKQVEIHEIARQTTANAERFFGFK